MAELPTQDAAGRGPSDPAAAASPARAGALPPALRLLRPQQWTKNALLFAAPLFARKLVVPEALALATLGFVCFCVASSSVYVVNDILDVERDRRHPDKRSRPIAAGDVSPAAALALAAALTVGALAMAFWIGPLFCVAVGIYLAMTHFYSLAGKNVVILDVMLIAAGFVLRAVSGALAIDVVISNWFILCTLFLAMFIALSKRKAERLALNDGVGLTRPVLARYTTSSLDAYTSTSMAGVLISYAMYVFHVHDAEGASLELLPLTLPFVMFGVFRYHLLVETTALGEKAEEILLRDRPLQLCVAGFAAVALAALHLGG